MFGRLVRCILGKDAVAKKKLIHGNPMAALGIEVNVSLAGITFMPEAEKIYKWRAQIQEALDRKWLPGGEASCLAGRLGFTSQHIFRRIGRAMLIAIYKQIRRRNGEIDDELEKVRCMCHGMCTLLLLVMTSVAHVV